MCKNWREKGNCKYNEKCLFAHGADELTKRSSANGPEPIKPLASTTPAEVKKEVVVESNPAAMEEKKPEAAQSSPLPTKVSLPIVSKESVQVLFETPAKETMPDLSSKGSEQDQTPAFTQLSTGNTT